MFFPLVAKNLYFVAWVAYRWSTWSRFCCRITSRAWKFCLKYKGLVFSHLLNIYQPRRLFYDEIACFMCWLKHTRPTANFIVFLTLYTYLGFISNGLLDLRKNNHILMKKCKKKTKTFFFELRAQVVLLVFSLKTKMNYNRSIYSVEFHFFSYFW